MKEKKSEKYALNSELITFPSVMSVLRLF